uniref:Uncharacterized protein n=1 Tax=Timema poppense TaxID=170557 RepID=A0A7R9CQE2_TIMPO|nr:unnamed protein product [Timema poppensis]
MRIKSEMDNDDKGSMERKTSGKWKSRPLKEKYHKKDMGGIDNKCVNESRRLDANKADTGDKGSKKQGIGYMRLQTHLTQLEGWLTTWRTSINVEKSTTVLFTWKRKYYRPAPLRLFGEQIRWADIAKYLGLRLDTKLTWKLHCNETV